MPTINLNTPTKDIVELDSGSSGWLEIISRNDGKRRPCAVPKKYFDVLFAWGFVTGSIGNASITPTGRGRAIDLQAARELKKAAEKRSKK